MKKIDLACLAAAVFLACTGSASAERFDCGSDRGASPYVLAPTGVHDHRRFAPAGATGPTRDFAAFAAAFDDDDDDNQDGRPDLTGNPTWVAYHLLGVAPTADGAYEEPNVSIDRPDRWYRSDDLSNHWIARPWITASRIDDSYRGVGRVWNRGHFAMADHAQRIGPEASCNTHVFWNASPQAADFNQGPWLHLETYTAALSNMVGEIWIITGPIFDDAPLRNIAEPHEVPVAVPHAFFKIIVREIDGAIDVRALIFEHPSVGPHGHVQPDPAEAAGWINCRSAGRAGHTYTPADNLVALRDVEARTGLRFLPDHPLRADLVDRQPDSLWHVPEPYWSGYLCGGQATVGAD
ncbi:MULTISPECIES: DNA/RNA non-specific endonuclease [Alphaproteobacteria]|jgi:DNA/RNA endonuclease G (NUC1)|uniref:DNA/RNA non-specific endonuclease n=1 Tax=Maricaulis virginensis TaxID=144022 RepID=A0A9W6MQH0_9PROT|nr:DNA/RNA non-specific endonuclease [Maricaulis virginensis]GLK53966.1 hypothetical protein GCM10017621_34740 [Maricaulis virginensis]